MMRFRNSCAWACFLRFLRNEPNFLNVTADFLLRHGHPKPRRAHDLEIAFEKRTQFSFWLTDFLLRRRTSHAAMKSYARRGRVRRQSAHTVNGSEKTPSDERFIRRADARRLGGRFKPGHGERFEYSQPRYSVRALGRIRRSQVTTIRRVTMTAVKKEVITPRPSVTAKPRTGPVPTA